MIYKVAERFKSVQGEGMYAGTPMAFIRFVGCSVGKKVCNACDTDFEAVHSWKGGGEYTPEQLAKWAGKYQHVCLTGGEPLDQHLTPLLDALKVENNGFSPLVHLETSGTVRLDAQLQHSQYRQSVWMCVSPKPGYLMSQVAEANEIKVIVPGLGSGDGWPGISDALVWAAGGHLVYLQPRNLRHDLDQNNLQLCQQLVLEHPQLRLSVQLHKLLRVR